MNVFTCELLFFYLESICRRDCWHKKDESIPVGSCVFQLWLDFKLMDVVILLNLELNLMDVLSNCLLSLGSLCFVILKCKGHSK